jgi:hypothetical protein
MSRAARLLGLSVCQLHRIRLAGKLKCFRVAGRWYTTERDMAALVSFPGDQGAALPMTDARRRRAIEAEHRRAAEMLAAPPRRPVA